jgi:CRISPR-associated exonuclease Cas4
MYFVSVCNPKNHLFSEDDLLSISALSHLLFCERRCALVHIEQAWDENRFTAEGRIMHEKVHDAGEESRGDVRISRGLRLRSLRLGLTGMADVVEFHEQRSDWIPFPVE